MLLVAECLTDAFQNEKFVREACSGKLGCHLFSFVAAGESSLPTRRRFVKGLAVPGSSCIISKFCTTGSSVEYLNSTERCAEYFVVDVKMDSFSCYFRFCHSCGTNVFSMESVNFLVQAKSRINNMPR